MTKISALKAGGKNGARSKLYLSLSKLFVYPDEEYIKEIAAGTIQNALIPITRELPYSLKHADFLYSHFTIDNQDEFQSVYIKTFDVSPGGPACPLYEGLYYPDRRKIMEDLMRFYEHFGLKPAPEKNELPDHISIELEFMHFLTFKEEQAISLGKEPKPLRLAQRDFLDRHLVKWLSMINEKLLNLTQMEYYKQLFLFIEEFVNEDFKYISDKC
jgi:DMSO reductase family type II enzyme chaperone